MSGNNSLESVLSPLAGMFENNVARMQRTPSQNLEVQQLLREGICGLLSKDALTALDVTLLATLLSHYKD